jgi:hypothetical protein
MPIRHYVVAEAGVIGISSILIYTLYPKKGTCLPLPFLSLLRVHVAPKPSEKATPARHTDTSIRWPSPAFPQRWWHGSASEVNAVRGNLEVEGAGFRRAMSALSTMDGVEMPPIPIL